MHPGLDFRWNNDTVEAIWLPVELERRAHMESKIRCRLLQDLFRGDRYPDAVDLHFVVASDLSPRGRATIRQIAARLLGVRAQQRLIKAAVPFVVAVPQMAFLRDCLSKHERYKQETQTVDKMHRGYP